MFIQCVVSHMPMLPPVICYITTVHCFMTAFTWLMFVVMLLPFSIHIVFDITVVNDVNMGCCTHCLLVAEQIHNE